MTAFPLPIRRALAGLVMTLSLIVAAGGREALAQDGGLQGQTSGAETGQAGVSGDAPTASQVEPGTLPTSPVLTVDSERLFAGSRFGQSLSARLESEAADIAAENRQIEADLAEEERSLTELRGQMEPVAFRSLAEEFDAKVSRIRREREDRAKTFGQSSDMARRQFLSAAEPVLKEIMRDAGAAVMLEQLTVFLSRDVVDITDEAIARIDATLLPQDPDEAVPDGAGSAPLDMGEPLPAPEAPGDGAGALNLGNTGTDAASPSE
ncbi:OmpH family outer membrane protein [Pseudooceanicola algae]|uniref:Uncharacterized protein n=1 Tax=Pseudooceanicola algae TaxID=1537215 RepID=A0A418SDY3_9RHOB|nr:OmpH family outer membrane protein [Pseudooceanicola algae]QPM89508.1 hypothetical protein PSAL_007290 [Pseudooceanicola algae]